MRRDLADDPEVGIARGVVCEIGGEPVAYLRPHRLPCRVVHRHGDEVYVDATRCELRQHLVEIVVEHGQHCEIPQAAFDGDEAGARFGAEEILTSCCDGVSQRLAIALGVENLQFTYDLVDGTTNPSNVETPPVANSANQIRKANLFIAARSLELSLPTGQFVRNSMAAGVGLRSLSFVDRYR